MFGFNTKKRLAQTGILDGLTDFHTHILPGVDDGIQSMEESLKVLADYESLGIKRVVVTPHIMEEYPQNTTTFLRARFDELRKAYTGSIEISLGAEYMMDNRFATLLDTRDLLPIWDRYLLIETAFVSPPLQLMERLEEVRSKGYFAVLAHPERYTYLQADDYQKLKEAGILFQLNLLSLVGEYGKTVKTKAKEVLNAGYYDFIGTDIHNQDHHIQRISRCKWGNKEVKQVLRIKNR